MEIRARYVLIGLFVLIVLVGGFGFVWWLNNNGAIGERTVYRIEFDGSISGLNSGADVLFNGLKVGGVTSLQLVPAAPGVVMATIAIDPRTPVRTDTHVGLVFAGLTGTATVALTGGSTSAEVPQPQDGQPALLVADPSAMKDMTQAARDVLGKLDTVVSENAASLKAAIANIASFSDALARNSNRVDGILQGLERLTGGKTEATPTNYDLTAPDTFPAIDAMPSAQLTIATPSAVIALDTQRIIMQTADGEQPGFADARWADNIPVLFQSRIVQSFENAKYLKVAAEGGDLEGDFKLAIDIRRFRISTVPGPAVAEVEFSAKLLDADGKVADARLFTANAQVSATDSAAVAAKGLNEAFDKASVDLVVWALATMNKAGDSAGDAPAPDDSAPPADAPGADAPTPADTPAPADAPATVQ